MGISKTRWGKYIFETKGLRSGDVLLASAPIAVVRGMGPCGGEPLHALSSTILAAEGFDFSFPFFGGIVGLYVLLGANLLKLEGSL